ncbi:molybdenum cofactor guanylyltransferase MobA [Pandoraea fibrosis]|uniref:Molybdenum cofactor guanylyltransferase n=1 Tax=Pandoraea fibrosis TaxID=1891094 RepID=A0A5E4UM42_9BURK|nr:molybdenum cofactor guanylyltransferase MobA [Pandoraea fibrosis]VVD99369.1 molybdopterin-guanine dinucleotide biosynthesis protein A [Pandoraea fibrosis]
MTAAPIPRHAITGLILAGGRGQRMGGRDKGLQMFAGRPLAAHVADRLRPQVGTLLISANRNRDAYAAFGAAVVSDETQDFAGPLAGMLAGLRAACTDYVLTAPCDAPYLPEDLGERLTAAIGAALADASAPPVVAAYAATTGGPHPVFALLHRSLADDLAATLACGEHRVRTWLARHKAVQVHFGDERPFYNVNTLDDLHPDTPRAP